jgi:hypothetical protein
VEGITWAVPNTVTTTPAKRVEGMGKKLRETSKGQKIPQKPVEYEVRLRHLL